MSLAPFITARWPKKFQRTARIVVDHLGRGRYRTPSARIAPFRAFAAAV